MSDEEIKYKEKCGIKMENKKEGYFYKSSKISCLPIRRKRYPSEVI